MSFGKRKFDPADRVPAAIAKQTCLKDGFALDMGTFVTAIAGLVIILCGGFIAGHAMGFSFGLGSDTALVSNYFKHEPVPKARDYDRNRGIYGVWHSSPTRAFHMETTETGFDAIDSELHERCMRKAINRMAIDAEITGKVKLRASEASKFITCSMSVFRSRFCKRHYRKRVASRIKKFLWLRDRANETQSRHLNSAIGRHMAAGFQQFGSQDFLADAPSIPRTGLPKGMKQQISELSGLGLLYASDFGTLLYPYPPEDVAPYLVEQKMQVCV